MKTEAQRNRIIENLFDIMCNTQFKDEAEKQMKKDLASKNISYNMRNQTIEIQTHEGTRVQYTISIQ